jgi:hypothetical protein
MAAPLEAAESACAVKDTPVACWEKILAQQVEQTHARGNDAKDTVAKAVAQSETGLDTSGANLATVARDFLSAFNVAGLLGAGTTDDADQGTAVMDLNFLLPGKIRGRNGQLKVVLDTEPSLYAPLKSAIEESGGEGAADTISELEGDLGDVGGATATFSLNWRGHKLGRYFSAHRDLYEALFVATRPDPAQDQVIAFGNVLQQAEDCVPDPTCNCTDASTCTFLQLTNGNQEAAGVLLAALEAAADEEEDLAARHRKSMLEGRLNDFASLVDNQPQLYGSAGGTVVDRLVGPDELSVEITYELPLAPNVNRFWKSRRGRLSEADLKAIRTDENAAANLLKEYRNYLVTHEDELETPDRFFFSLQYIDRDRLDVTLPDDDGSRHEFPGSESLIVEVGWGRPIELKPDGTVRTRADLVGSWEDVSDDPTRHDRGVLALTVTRDFGDFSVPLGIVYSNKPEFIAAQDLDEQISAHVGIKYSVDGLGGGGN